MARFADCQFNETVFPTLRGEKSQQEKQEISWYASTHFDPRTNICESKVQRISHTKKVANQLPDAVTDNKRVTKSHIPVVNAPIRIRVPIGQSIGELANTSETR